MDLILLNVCFELSYTPNCTVTVTDSIPPLVLLGYMIVLETIQ